MPKTTKKTALTGETKTGKMLTEHEENFCKFLVTSFSRVDSVIKAYNIDTDNPKHRATAAAMAYELLTRPHINERLRELLDLFHFNDLNVDLELSSILQQNQDVKSKLGAIREYNKLKARYVEAPQNIILTHEQLLAALKNADKNKKK